MESSFKQFSVFYKPDEMQQQPDQAVDVSNWNFGELQPYEEGAREKTAFSCPSQNEFLFLIPGHRYMYKKSLRRKESGFVFFDQFWVEIVAYKLGRRLGIEVPPAFVAYRKTATMEAYEYASLIEWTYGHSKKIMSRAFNGSTYMIEEIPDYNLEKGKEHNFLSVVKCLERDKVERWLESLLKTLLLDALIGNQDRHQNNWEVILSLTADFTEMGLLMSFSPAIDNGTALGYEILEQDIPKRIKNLRGYILRGRHHMKWSLDSLKKAGHFQMLVKIKESYPESIDIFKSILNKKQEMEAVYNDIMELTKFDILNSDYQLSIVRADFMIALLRARFEEASKSLGL